jgi:altronate dehydratase large subunit
VGEDAAQARRVFAGLAANPNIGSALLVGLGCETIQGPPLLDGLMPAVRQVRYLGIQDCGGSAAAISHGQAIVRELADRLAGLRRVAVPPSRFVLGIAAGDGSVRHGVVDAIAGLAGRAGARVIVASSGAAGQPPFSWPDAVAVGYGERCEASLAVMPGSGSGAEQHTGLAAAGSQVIVSFRGPRQAPLGFPVCPVISVGTHLPTFMALSDDFDIDGSAGAGELAARIWAVAVAVFNGRQTAAERRGARDFGLRRISRST